MFANSYISPSFAKPLEYALGHTAHDFMGKISLLLVCPTYKRLTQEWPNPSSKNVEALATDLLHGFDLYKQTLQIGNAARNQRASATLKGSKNNIELNFTVDLQAPLEANYCALVSSVIDYAYNSAQATKSSFISVNVKDDARDKAHGYFIRGWLSEKMTALGLGAPVPELAAFRAQRLARAKQCAAPHP